MVPSMTIFGVIKRNSTANYAKHCSNGHPLKVGEPIGIAHKGTIHCIRCIDADFLKPEETKVIYSNKFCGKCFLELPLAGGPCQNCD